MTYGSSPTKRPRRTRADVGRIKATAFDLLRDDNPMTIRQLFYRLVSLGTIAKTEAEYKSTVGRLLIEMRRDGEVPFNWIADNTRWMRKPRTHSSLAGFLRRSAETYRRSIWDNQDAYVEVWLEKDALAGVLIDVTDPWDVPLMVTRGYASLSYLHAAAVCIKSKRKPAFLYYLGDHDPSGLDITRVGGGRHPGVCPGGGHHLPTDRRDPGSDSSLVPAHEADEDDRLTKQGV